MAQRHTQTLSSKALTTTEKDTSPTPGNDADQVQNTRKLSRCEQLAKNEIIAAEECPPEDTGRQTRLCCVHLLGSSR